MPDGDGPSKPGDELELNPAIAPSLDADAPPPKRGWLSADYYRIPRWVAAVGLLLFCVIELLNSGFHVCNDVNQTKGAEVTVTRTCNGPTVTDAGTVAVALLIVLLITPDMTEIGVFGVSLKRRLAAAEDKASKSAAKAESLETQVQIQTARIENITASLATANSTAGAAASAQVHQYFLSGSPAERAEAAKFGAELPTKAAAFVRGDVPQPVATPSASGPAKADPALAAQLIENWELLAASLDWRQSRRGPRSEFLRIKVPSEQAERFRMIFDEELRFVRLARNNVAHAQPIAAQELQSAVDVSNELLRILRTQATQ